MNKKTFFSLCAFLVMFSFYFIQVSSAGEISELKAKIESLQTTVDTLEEKVEVLEKHQKMQAEETEKIPAIIESVEEIREEGGFSEGVDVGGHFKFYLLDKSVGERNDDLQRNNLSAGINHVYLYFRKELDDWLGLNIETDIPVTAGATPSLGSDISRATSGSVSISIHQAFVTMRLHQEIEAKVGLFSPLFSEDYAKEIWWDHLYHQNKGLDYLQSWRDMGIELYRNFDLEEWSLPVYLYYLNGNTAYNGQFVDNNDGKTVLFHAAPELFMTRLRLLGSFGYGKWDNANNNNILRYVLGFDWNCQNLNITSEYLYSQWDNLSLTGGGEADGMRDGYYIKALFMRSIIKASLFLTRKLLMSSVLH